MSNVLLFIIESSNDLLKAMLLMSDKYSLFEGLTKQIEDTFLAQGLEETDDLTVSTDDYDLCKIPLFKTN